MKYQKLSEYAKNNGIKYGTAYLHYQKGLIKNIKILESGTILVGIDDDSTNNENRIAIYSRVSSNAMKENLYRQAERLENYAINNGYQIIHSIKEIASGMNDTRPKLQELLKKNDFDFLLVEHKDRLTRFGFNYIETLLNKDNKKIIVVNHKKNDNENLMEDLISIIYSFSARMYGQRKAKVKSKNIIEEIKKCN